MATPRYQQRMVGYSSAYRSKNIRRSSRWSFNNNRFSGFSFPRFGWWKKVAWIVLWWMLMIGLWWFARFWTQIVTKLPDINDIEDFNFKQSTVITDRNGIVLYRMFEENRQYVPYQEISPHFVNWLVATEDQRFRENAWIDPIGMVRAAITDVTQWKTHGASTLTQQLIKMMMLTPEKKIERKLKEIILAVKINDYIKSDISETTKWLSNAEIDKKVKEKIMELYSNLIFLWNNAYGVEAAAQTYFNTKAKDLTILQSAILAWMPQAPSRYDPYGNRGILMGKFVVTDKEWEEVIVSPELEAQIYTKAKAVIEESTLKNQKEDQALIDFLISARWSKTDDWSGNEYTVKYVPWRKDIVLARMFEENYITEFELKKSLSEWVDYQFHHNTVSIKAPHFVFWIIEQLKQQYDQETLQKWWLTVTTSLDYTIQEMAEQSIIENKERLSSNRANNSSLIYADSQNGDILAYVGSIDYNNEEIDGQVDMIQSMRQPWSTIKPFVYALWFMKTPLTLDSPIYDLRMKIDKDEPNNADWGFWWLTTIRQALAASRNIPAIKMFFNVWWEGVLKKFLGELWIQNLTEWNKFYWYPLAIGAAEMKMMDLTNAYMHLSAMWTPAKINPILEIRWPNNNLLYKKEVEMQEKVIPQWVAYLMWQILSDNRNMPADWVRQFTAPWKLIMATKSWTTNIVKDDKKLPRDWWLMTYTPSKVLWLRWWNTNGSPMIPEAYWWWLNSWIRKSFLGKLLKEWYIQNETATSSEVKEVVISKISWKLASQNTPAWFAAKSLSYALTTPTEFDSSVTSTEVDMLCNGTPTELTPPSDIKTAFILTPETMMPDKRDLDDIRAWRETNWIEAYKESIGPIIIRWTEWELKNCEERAWLTWDVSLTIVKPTSGEKISRSFSIWHKSSSSNPIKTVKVFLWSQELQVLAYRKWWSVNDITTITVPDTIPLWTHELKLVVIDEKWVSKTQSVSVVLIDADTSPPYIMENKVQIDQQSDGSYRIGLLFGDESSTIVWWIIQQNGVTIKTFENNSVVTFTVSTLWSISWTASDSANNKWSWTIDLTKYKIKNEQPVPENSLPEKPVEPAPQIQTGGEVAQ
jgi:penicillin-binding protein 1A